MLLRLLLLAAFGLVATALPVPPAELNNAVSTFPCTEWFPCHVDLIKAASMPPKLSAPKQLEPRPSIDNKTREAYRDFFRDFRRHPFCHLVLKKAPRGLIPSYCSNRTHWYDVVPFLPEKLEASNKTEPPSSTTTTTNNTKLVDFSRKLFCNLNPYWGPKGLTIPDYCSNYTKPRSFPIWPKVPKELTTKEAPPHPHPHPHPHGHPPHKVEAEATIAAREAPSNRPPLSEESLYGEEMMRNWLLAHNEGELEKRDEEGEMMATTAEVQMHPHDPVPEGKKDKKDHALEGVKEGKKKKEKKKEKGGWKEGQREKKLEKLRRKLCGKRTTGVCHLRM